MASVLIVDDDSEIRELVRIMLEMDGHVTYEAGDGSEAIDKTAMTQPDLILTDIQMPVMDGWRCHREASTIAWLSRENSCYDCNHRET